MADIVIDGCAMPVETPASAVELADRVRGCVADRTAIFPVGGGVGLDYGLPPTRPGIALSLAQLNRVVDYPARDLTITVEAGITLANLQAVLAAEGQRLPIDVPFPERATLGGAIAVDADGPRRLGYGQFRDWIIGITVVNGHGELCSAGGRVVKNVAGYDLCKLYTGSLGSLGIITQVTLKLQPIPPASAWAQFEVATDRIAATLDFLNAGGARPVAVELVSDGAAWRVAVLFEDNLEAVDWQLNELAKFRHNVARLLDAEVSYVSNPNVATCPFALLATIRPSAVAAFVNAIHPPGMVLQAHALSGIVRLGFTDIDFAAAQALQQLALKNIADGNVVIRRCPIEWKTQLPIWGRPPASLALMKRVKHELDPMNLLNPGRMAVG